MTEVTFPALNYQAAPFIRAAIQLCLYCVGVLISAVCFKLSLKISRFWIFGLVNLKLL